MQATRVFMLRVSIFLTGIKYLDISLQRKRISIFNLTYFVWSYDDDKLVKYEK